MGWKLKQTIIDDLGDLDEEEEEGDYEFNEK